MSHRLPNYLRTFRKRAGFSQDEIAFLLGVQSGSKVCRYERFVREPSPQAIFAYEVIFNTAAEQLFGGAYEQVEKKVAKRAALLTRRISNLEPNRFTAKKVKFLRSISPAPKKES